MSTSTFHTRHLVVIVLVLTFLVGWKEAKDWVQSSSAKDPTKLRASTKPVILPFPSPAVRNLEPAKPAKALEINETYGKLPLSFEVNQGQVDSEVRFLSRGRGYSLYLTSTEAVLQLPIDESRISDDEAGLTSNPLRIPSFEFRMESREPTPAKRERALGNRKSTTLQMKLVGANPQAQVEGLEPLLGRSNYFLGNDPRKWRTHVPNYSKVKYKEVYPGIDLIYYGNQQRLEYDWVVAPGADPKKIWLAFQGAKQIRLDQSGNLRLETAGGEIRQHRPNVYQESNGSRTELEGGYVLASNNHVQFEVARYDVTKPLIIDPVLVYSTFLGGAGNERGHAIAVDALGNVYIAGSTESVDFPTLGPAQRANRGNRDVFVSKLNPSGSALIYSTFLGGTDFEDSTGIAVDTAGNAHVTGYTMSTNFPVANALQPVSRGKVEGFVCKLSPTGSNLVYSTYLGGSGDDGTSNIAVDVAGNAHVTGYTISTDFPVANALQPTLKGQYDAFLSKLNPAGSALVYSTYLGGSSDDAALDLAVDASGNAYVVGWTTSTDFPTKNPLQPAHGGKGAYDAFVTKVNSAGTALVYSTYLGGGAHDIAWSVALDSSGNACLAGGTTSDNFPTVKPLQSSFGRGGHDAFVAKLDAAGASLVFSTFLGGNDGDEAHRIATDATGNIYVVGFSRSQDFPTLNSIKPRNLIGFDAFLAKLPPSGTSLVYSSLLGGSEDENCRAVAVDGQGNVYLAGNTSSSNFPTTNPLQAAYLGSGDAFVVKISGNPELTATVSVYVPIVLSAGGLNNSFYTSELTLTNRGTTDAKLDFNYAAAFGGGSGQGSDVLRAGRQKIVPDAIDYLRSAGVPIPDTGGRGGTLSVTFSGLSSYTDAAVTVRTTTALSDGRAGLSYSGIPHWNTLTGISYLCGLRQNSTDRSNVAVQHMGSAADRDLILSLTVFSGDPNAPFSQVLPDITLAPGGFYQISGILQSNGIALTNGFVKVERKSGNAPYYAYAVINDQVNSDGSFVPPVPDYSGSFARGENLLVVPVVVENSRFSSELVLTNYSQQVTDLTVSSDGARSTPGFRLFTLQPGEQLIIPNIVQYLRDHSFSSVGLPGTDFVGPLFLRTFSIRAVFVGARTSTPGGGGWYGLFYPAITSGESLRDSAWLYGLQQNSENRTNLALVNTGEASGDTDLFNIELFDGESGLKVNTVEGVTLEATRWMQIGTILAQYAPGVTQGYAHVIRTAGSNPFIAYAVINDGGQPGERTDDGAFLASSP